MVGVVNTKQVAAIIPSEIIDAYFENSSLETAIYQSIKPNETTQLVSSKEDRLLKKEEKKFLNLRQRLILKAFGMNINDYLTIIDESNNLDNEKNRIDDSAIARLFRKMKIAKGQVNSNKKDLRAMIKEIAIYIGSILGATILAKQVAALSAVFASINAILPGIGSALSGTVLAYTVAKGLLARKGNVSDAEDKIKEYQEELDVFLKHLKAFEEKINQDKELILNASKTMKKADFKKFLDDYLNKTIDGLGLREYIKGRTDKNKKSLVEDLKVEEGLMG